MSVLSHKFSSFGLASNEPFWPEARLLRLHFPKKPDLFSDFLQVKVASVPLIAAFLSVCSALMKHSVSHVNSCRSGGRANSGAKGTILPLPVISILSAHHSTKQPSVPFITGSVLTQLSFWPHPPQPGSEISGSGI